MYAVMYNVVVYTVLLTNLKFWII